MRTKVKEAIDNEVNARIMAREGEIIAEALEEASAEYEHDIEEIMQVVEEQVSTHVTKLRTDEELAIAEFKEYIVDKLTDFLSAEIDRIVPESYIEHEAELAIYKPIVDGLKSLMAENYISIQAEEFKLLEQSRDAITQLRQEKSQALSEMVQLRKKIAEADKTALVAKICSELTAPQAKRFRQMTSRFTVEDLTEKWETIVDMVLDSDIRRMKKPGNGTPGKSDLKEGRQIDEDDQQGLSGMMQMYVDEIKRQRGSNATLNTEGVTDKD